MNSSLDYAIISEALQNEEAVPLFRDQLIEDGVGKINQSYGFFQLYKNILTCHEEVGSVDFSTFGIWLEDYPDLHQSMGGQDGYKKLVEELKKQERISPDRLIKLANKSYHKFMMNNELKKVQELINDDQASLEDIDKAQQSLQSKMSASRGTGVIHVRNALDIAAEADELWDTLPFIPTQYKKVNAALGYSEEHGGVMRGNIYSIVATSGLGKPLSIDTMVLMGDGNYKKLGQVQTGETVINSKGKVDLVTAVHKQGILPILKITTSLGREVDSAYDHGFLTKDGWKEAQDLLVGDVLLTPANIEIEKSNSGKTLEEFRLAGYIIGDGCFVSGNQNVTCFDPIMLEDLKHCANVLGYTFNHQARGRYDLIVKKLGDIQTDPKLSNLKAREIETLYAIHLGGTDNASIAEKMNITENNVSINLSYIRKEMKVNSIDEMYQISNTIDWVNGDLVRSGNVMDWINDLGLSGGSKEKRIPSWVFSGSKEEIGNFLGGYFETDGHLTNPDNSRRDIVGRGSVKTPIVEFYSINKNLLQDTQRLLLRLGIKSRLSLKKGTYKGERHLSWRLTFSHPKYVAKFQKNVPLFGKKNLWLKDWGVLDDDFEQDFIEDKITSIEKNGSQECRCLTVEDDHTFLANDLVVHNSTWAKSLCNYWLDQGMKVLFINFEEARDHWERILMTQVIGHNVYKGFDNKDSVEMSKLTEKFKDKMKEWGERFMVRHDPDSLYYEDLEVWIRSLYGKNDSRAPDIVVIDTIQSLFTKSGGGARWGEFEQIMVRLEKLAKDMNAVFIITAQQNSNALKENRDEFNQSDIGGGVTIVQKSSVVMILAPRKTEIDIDSYASDAVTPIMEVHIPKNRITGNQTKGNPPLIKYDDDVKLYQDYDLSSDLQNQKSQLLSDFGSIDPTLGI